MQAMTRELTVLWRGIRDATRLPTLFHVVYLSNTLWRLARKSFLLNAVLYLGSLVVSHWFILPTLSQILPGYHEAIFSSTFLALFYTVWLYPCFALSFFFNMFWFGEFCGHAFSRIHRKQTSNSNDFGSVKSLVANELVQLGVLLTYSLLRSLVSFLIAYTLEDLPKNLSLPWVVCFVFWCISISIQYVLTSILYAYYAFSYRWAAEGIQLEVRLGILHRSFSYFVGFGLPLTIVSSPFGFFVSDAIYSLLFPAFLILSICAHPPIRQSGDKFLCIPVFRLPLYLTNRFAMCVCRRQSVMGSISTMSESLEKKGEEEASDPGGSQASIDSQ